MFHVKQVGSVLGCEPTDRVPGPLRFSPKSAHDTSPVTNGVLNRLWQQLGHGRSCVSVMSGRWSGLQDQSLRILGTGSTDRLDLDGGVAVKARVKTWGPSPWPNVVNRSVGSGSSSYHRQPFGILPSRGDRAVADSAAAFDEGPTMDPLSSPLAMKSSSDGGVPLARDIGRCSESRAHPGSSVRELQLPAAFAFGDHHSPIHVGSGVEESLVDRVW